MTEFDEYGKKVYRGVLYLRSIFLSTTNERSNNPDADDDDVDELLLQGKSKRINSGDQSITAGSKLVVFEPQKKVLHV